MDGQSRNKALFRAKLNALKKEKRIESPLVRYNDSDEPVCRVCELVLKSNSQWDAHQASRKHREAISALKANAAGASRPTSKNNGPRSELPPKPRPEPPKELNQSEAQPSTGPPMVRASSGLPADFFDIEAKIPKPGILAQGGADDSTKIEDGDTGVPAGSMSRLTSSQSLGQIGKTTKQNESAEVNQAKGALPEGFFDNKDADLRARGIKPVKIDVKDEYKEFEKLIQEDLQVVDNRMEEEEIDAAEDIEEAETLEQKAYRERVEILRRKKQELMANRSAKRRKGSEEAKKEASPEEESSSSSDDDTDEGLAVDWRAQHL